MRCNRAWTAVGRLTIVGMIGSVIGSVIVLGLLLVMPMGRPLFAQATPADSFARYETPGQCEQAAMRFWRFYWRDKHRDTVNFAPATDSVPAPVAKAARRCASRFSAATLGPRDLLHLTELYWWTDQDALAQAAADRLIHLQSSAPVAVRGRTLQVLSTDLLSTRPSRLALARGYLAQLDALGVPAALWRMLAHTEFSRYAMTTNDLTTAVAEARAALAAASQMDQPDRIDQVYAILDAYQVLAEPLAIVASGPTVLSLFDTVSTTLLPLRPAGTRERRNLQIDITEARAPYTLVGTTGAPLTATHWFQLDGDSSQRPRAGHVSLLVFVNASCGGRCYPTYATLRRLQAQYTRAGLDVIFLASTHEYFRNHPMPSATIESDSTASYFGKFLHFSVPVSVETTHFSHLADGRLNAAPTPNGKSYDRDRNGILIDKRGMVVLVDSLQPDRETTWNAMIRKALQ